MALIFMDGFDKYGPANNNATGVAALLTVGEWTTASQATIAIGLSQTGYAMTITAPSTVTKTLPGNYARLIGGMRFSSNLVSVSGVQFLDGGANQAGICINAAGTITFRNGSYVAGTILSTSTASITANTTHYLEWDITFGNSANYQLWLDGVSILSGTGDTTTTANNTASGFSLLNSSTNITTVDDLYLFDSTGSTNNAVLLTSPRIETQFPTSDGAVQFAVGAGILGSSVARTASTNAPAAASLVLRRFTPPVACTLNSVTIMPGATSAGANYRGVVYADSGGTAPGTLLSSGTQVTGVTSGTAKDLPLTTPQSLSAGAQYWLGFINDTSVALAQLDGSTVGYRAANTYASGAPGTAPAMTSGQATWLFWGNLSGITGNNWYEVSQNPTNGSYDYVFDATVGHEDLYSFPALSAPPSAIYAVAVKASLSKSDAGAKTASVRLKSSTTDSAGTGGTALAPGTSYGWMTSHYPTDPNTSAAWTLSALNSAQAGVKIET